MAAHAAAAKVLHCSQKETQFPFLISLATLEIVLHPWCKSAQNQSSMKSSLE